MRYIIMADGHGKRWHEYTGVNKHLINIGGETLLSRTVRLIKQLDDGAEIIITSHNPAYEVEGARRYEPKNNVLEIDRFTRELICSPCCFLYGDTYYTEQAMSCIVNKSGEGLAFFGSSRSIVALKVADSALMLKHLDRVRELYLAGEVAACKGWQVYQSYIGKELMERNTDHPCFTMIADITQDFNTPQEYEAFIKTDK